MLKKIIFIILTAGFFIVPCVSKTAGNWAPGIAVLAGIIFSTVWGNPFLQYTSKLTSTLLGATIVGMGFGMNLLDVLRSGANGFLYTFVGIALGIGLGVTLGKILKISENAAYLVSVGTSICGGSAIAAAAPVLKAKAHDIALSAAVVFLFNAVALWIFPIVGKALGFSQLQFGYWAALGIHDTSSVVGAAMAYGPEALEIGTTVKLARALWICPVTLFLSYFAVRCEEGEKAKFKLRIPWFIPYFLLASALITFVPEFIPCTAEAIGFCGSLIKNISKYLMISTLFLIGANLSKDKLKELGLRPVLLGFILWVILASFWCAAIYFNIVKCVK